MAPLPVIANVYRTVFEWDTSVSTNPVNVLHFRGAPGSAAGLYTAINANVTAAMWAIIASTVSVENVIITPLDGISASVENPTGGGAKWSGGSASSPIPAVCGLLKLRTAKRGPSYRGRMYYPYIAESATAAGTIAALDASNVTAAWVTFRTAVAAAGYTLVVASYKLGTAELVTTAQMETETATQRRRQSALR